MRRGSATPLAQETATVIKTSNSAQRWSKPELVKLGALKDVAGGSPTPTQNANNS